MKYRKKPVEIEAMQTTADSVGSVVGWMTRSSSGDLTFSASANGEVRIRTLEGTMTASPGDWIIRGVQGEFYPCKPDIFEATYDPVTS